jgi:hypothetical protein
MNAVKDDKLCYNMYVQSLPQFYLTPNSAKNHTWNEGLSMGMKQDGGTK